MIRYLSYNLIILALLSNGYIACSVVDKPKQKQETIAVLQCPIYWQKACYVGPLSDLQTQPTLLAIIDNVRHAVRGALASHNIFDTHTVYYYPNTHTQVMVREYLFIYDWWNNKLKLLSGDELTNDKLFTLPQKNPIVFQLNETLITPDNLLYASALYWRHKVEQKLKGLGIRPPLPLTSVIFNTQYPHYSCIFYGDDNKPIGYEKRLKKFGFLDKNSGRFTAMSLLELRNRVGYSNVKKIP